MEVERRDLGETAVLLEVSRSKVRQLEKREQHTYMEEAIVQLPRGDGDTWTQRVAARRVTSTRSKENGFKPTYMALCVGNMPGNSTSAPPATNIGA